MVDNALPFALLSWGQQYIDSALAAILIGTTPIFTILIAHFTSQDDRLTPTKIAGIGLGLCGLLLLFSPALLEGVRATVWGLAASTGAAASYGLAIAYGRQHLRGLPPLVAPATPLTTAPVFLLPIALLFEQPLAQPIPSWTAINSLLAVAIVCTVLAYIAYYRVMEIATATSLSMITYLVPVVATFLGIVILGEQLALSVFAGCGFIIGAIMVINGFLKLPANNFLSRPGRRKQIVTVNILGRDKII